MNTHNIRFHGEIIKILYGYPLSFGVVVNYIGLIALGCDRQYEFVLT